MKRLILASALVSTSALADPTVLLNLVVPPMIYQSYREDKAPEEKMPMTVVATGEGKTCEQALENAKVIAVERVAGLWMTAERNTDGKQYNEKITDYTGSLIKSYTVIDNQCNRITIEAQVVPRTNKIASGGADVKQETRDHLQEKINNERKRQLAIKEVNDRSKAVLLEVQDIEFDLNKMIIVVDASFQEKWKHDYYDLKKHAGKIQLDSFYKPLRVAVKGYKVGNEVFSQQYQLQYEAWNLYRIRDDDVIIHPERKDRIKLTFPVDSGKIMSVDKFVVNLI